MTDEERVTKAAIIERDIARKQAERYEAEVERLREVLRRLRGLNYADCATNGVPKIVEQIISEALSASTEGEG